ncbi:RNA-binding protein [Trypanosoma cruzi]|uniref:RNA-binding protein n=2 Tax=Trypanosoma cruzi TaxID=5693 RepID=V5BSU3_TRYCR|nr:RNA-binding protein [Trypanosoma cruzi Dm28c]KAF8283654.1 RNA-binding protein [Trypanosoma cruzi]PBJ79261.1 RNA-binding protein [Trypanosoma cruzi cruzi]PWU96350.1 putative RNA-binding protein [Trypanosoma cruzi]RNF21656.1 RNA-binding protein [Trypanosoma cruzi]
MSQIPLVSQYDPYGQTAQLQQLQQQQQQHIPPAQMNPEPDVLRNLMVNYIPTTVDEVQLRQLFERYGPIESVKIVCDRETRQSRGYGFVKFQSGSSAQQAIAGLNGFNILNKRLKVALAASGHQRSGIAGAVGDGNGYLGAYGGYGAYPSAANPYAQQQMMAMYQQYMMQAPQQTPHQGQQQQMPLPSHPQQQSPPQQQQQSPSSPQQQPQSQQQSQAARPVRR